MFSEVMITPTRFVQTIVLALSIFNLVTFLWLALTVWLNGDRRRMIARVGIVGLTLSALFFFIHALLIVGPLQQASVLSVQEFLWHVIWLPALGVPYIWFAIGLHYASLMNEQWQHRRPLLLAGSAVLGLSILLLLIFNSSTFTFIGTIRLLAYSDVNSNVESIFPLVLLPVLFLCYLTFCAIGPWFTPHKIARLTRVVWQSCTGYKGGGSFRLRIADAFWDDQMKVEALEEPVLSWHLARPGLLVAALLMVALTTGLGVLGVWSMVHWLATSTRPQPSAISYPPLTAIPLQLMVLDLFAMGAVAFIILFLGYSVVRHGILIERPLARRGFLEQWRGIVIVATAVAVFIAWLVMLTQNNAMLTQSDLSGLLVITSLATVAYALFTWSSYTAHDRYIALLGPFLQSTNLRHWLNTDLQKTEQSMETLFFHLCQDVLEVRAARLEVLAGPLRRSFSYCWPFFDERDRQTDSTVSTNKLYAEKTILPWSPDVTATRMRITVEGQPMICWVLPIYDELGLVAKLFLGPRQDGSGFTDEDMELAHACGQRILDTLRDHEAMQTVAGLLRRRIVDVKLLDAQHRRVLHDEILPQMHLALLRLETLRPFVNSHDDVEPCPTIAPDLALQEAIECISDSHRRLAAMMRSTTPSTPHRLERDGLMHAIHVMIVHDFEQAFDEVQWEVPEETMHRIDEAIPPALAEITFAAVQEALRNAARHGRGIDIHRRLCLTFKASLDPHLEVLVTDDGVGIHSTSSTTTGTGGGLLTHSALLAVAGGSLTVKSTPNEGVTVRILLPAEALR